MSGIFYGAGVGPGDPELLTVKALRVMKQCPVIAIPVSDKNFTEAAYDPTGTDPAYKRYLEKCVAYQIAVQAGADIGQKAKLYLPMPMMKEKEQLRQVHDEGAEKTAELLEKGMDVVFITLGDPTVYSTCMYIHKSKKTTLVGASTGLVVGLVAITPGAGFVPIWSSFLIGALVSPICYFTVVLLKQKLKIDDALDAFGCHGIGGIWGGIATGLFGKTSVNSVARWNGLVFGDFHLFTAQLISILVTIAVAVCGTLICIGIVRIFTPLRVDVSDEISGLDFSQHGENAYPSFNGFDS